MPDNYLVLAVLSTLICLPFGIVSIIKSTQVERLWLSGDRMGAHKASDDARKWALIGIGVSFVAGILYFIIMLVLTATPFLFINKWLYELFSLFS